MISFLKKKLSSETIKSIEAKVIATTDNGDDDAAWREVQPLLPAQKRQKEAAICLLRLVDGGKLSHDRAIDLLEQVNVVHGDDEEMLGLLGEALEGARDIDDLNAPPPGHPLFQSVVDRLAGVAEESRGLDSEESVLRGLATAARMMGRQRDEVAERSCKRLVELDAKRSDFHYNLGLFYKTRGKYSRGVIANRNAANLVDEPSESVEWNLGICATGSEDLESDSIIYSHTENFKILCSSCWRDPNLDHEHHPQVEKHVVTGRIAAPTTIEPSALLDQLDRAFATRKPCRIYVPELRETAGSSERAIFEKRRYDLINEN